MAETGCGGVKVEGGAEMAETIDFLTQRGVPVFGHVGLMPQSVHTAGGYRARGRKDRDAAAILADARAVAEAGAFALVIESTMEPVARRITKAVPIPTIGIGASPACDGQILVTDDLLGLFPDFTPKFVKRYAELGRAVETAAKSYATDVRRRRFPRTGPGVRRQAGQAAGTLRNGAMPLKVVRTVSELRAQLGDWKCAALTVGLVPTMGALHDGHLSLVRRSLATCARTCVTLFVNPKQFGTGEDLAAYPRDEAADVALAAGAGAHLVFAPRAADMYPQGFATRVAVPVLGDILEGEHRPGFFTGVATVVAKLLMQALPERAFFGDKDYQQLLVIRRLAADLDIPVAIEGCPNRARRRRPGPGVAQRVPHGRRTAPRAGPLPGHRRCLPRTSPPAPTRPAPAPTPRRPSWRQGFPRSITLPSATPRPSKK